MLGSRHWTSDERIPIPALGEWNGRQEWWRGDPPARRPLPVLVGNPNCVASGEKPGLPIIPDVSAFCAKILPDACYGIEEEIFAKTNILDCVFAKVTADIINTAYTDLPAAEVMVSDYFGPLAVVSSFSVDPDNVPSGVFARIGDTVVLFLTGTTNFQQLALQIFYFGTGPINQGLYSTSALYEHAANVITALMSDAGLGTAERFVLTGHSYGGAACLVIAAKMRLANPNVNVELLTLGAPMAGDVRLHDLIAVLFQKHYANERDPVPYMPPRGVTFAALLPFIGPILALVWPTFVRAPKVVTITEDGHFIDERTEDLPDDLITIATLAIAAGIDAPRFKNHGTDWYSYYLCKACSCVPRPCVEPPPPVLAFDVELDILAYDIGSGPDVLSIPPSSLAAIAFFPNGDPKNWRVAIPGVGNVLIESAQDGLGNYTTFRVTTDPDPTPPLWLCYWDFTAAEMMTGIDTSDFPDVFNGTVLSLGSLIVLPSFL